ncbi:hypothetical protein E3E11_04335 [Oecophyllibacter saccharovorans]|uniref:hypothetical protein n=1 Tax=Oecophyllibacter saccharovorans TaxID=2558360 RepID=UPI001142E406|nr:hypothetical protein [Oecophyllibacter saccharovorans]QDH15209.1 hypothetical protein E3E11_04335 [Oecophyllibacter saccharovorans]
MKDRLTTDRQKAAEKAILDHRVVFPRFDIRFTPVFLAGQACLLFMCHFWVEGFAAEGNKKKI